MGTLIAVDAIDEAVTMGALNLTTKRLMMTSSDLDRRTGRVNIRFKLVMFENRDCSGQGCGCRYHVATISAEGGRRYGDAEVELLDEDKKRCMDIFPNLTSPNA
jgi:hypothetical protein